MTVVGTATTVLQPGRYPQPADPNSLHRGERAGDLGRGLRSRPLTTATPPATRPVPGPPTAGGTTHRHRATA